MSLFDQLPELPHEILMQIFEQLDLETLRATRSFQSTEVHKKTRYHCFRNCIRGNDFTSMPWLLKFKHDTLGSHMYDTAIEYNSTNGIQLLNNLKCPHTDSMCVLAIKHKNLYMLEYFFKSGYKLTSDLMHYAAQCNYDDDNNSIIKFLIDNVCEVNDTIIAMAAHTNCCNIIQYCATKGYYPNDNTFVDACRYNVEIGTKLFDQLLKMDCRPTVDALEHASYASNTTAVHWLLKNNCPMSPNVLRNSIELQDLPSVVLLIQYKCPMDPIIFDAAVGIETIWVLELLLKCGCPYIITDIIRVLNRGNAFKPTCKKTIAWVKKNLI